MIAESPFTAVLGAMSSDTRTDDSLIHAARALITSGMAVVVCRPGTKFPMCTLTAKEIRDADTLARMEALENDDPRAESARHRCGLHHSLTDTKTSDRVLKRLIASHGRVNLGIDVSRSTQTASWSPGTLPETRRLLVVDVDTEDQLRHFRDAWENVTKEPFPTMTISSPGVCDTEGAWVHKGGGHFYFSIPPKYNAALDADTFSGALTSETGWSAMWSGRQILVPPSSRPEGRYVLTGSVHELPEWLGHRVVQHIVTRRRRAQEQETRRLERVASGTESNVDAWSRAVSWDELLEPLEWVKTGSVTTCGCPEWTAPGWHANPKSATAHEPGCSDPRIDTSMGYGPLHLWTDNPPEELRDLPGSSSGKTCSKIMFMALMYYRGSIAIACRGLGIAREDGPGLLRPLQGVTLSPEQGMGEGHEEPGSIPPPSYSAIPKPESEVVEDEEYLKLLGRHRAQQRLEQTHADELADLERVRAKRRLDATDAARQELVRQRSGSSGWDDELYDETELDLMPDLEPLVHGWFNKDSDVRIYGPSGHGKSFAVLDLALCVANGMPWHGAEVEQGKVLYIAAEGARGIKKRIRSWRTRFGGTASKGQFTVKGRPVQLAAPEQLIAATEENQYALVIFDTQARTTVGLEENSASDTAIVTEAIRRIRQAGGKTTVMLVHHTGKDEGLGARGSNSGTAAMDTEILVTKKDSVVSFSVAKQKDDEDGKSREFILTAVDGTDSCVLLPMDPLTAAAHRKDGTAPPVVPLGGARLPDGAHDVAVLFREKYEQDPCGGFTVSEIRTELMAEASGRTAKDRARKRVNRAFSALRGAGFIVPGDDNAGARENGKYRWRGPEDGESALKSAVD